MTNAEIADRLDEVANLLETQDANPFRIRAYRNAAATVRNLPVPVADLYGDQGLAGLERVRYIGPALARAIRDLLTLGRLPMLERLRGDGDPVRLFASVPGLGAGLAERVYHDLELHTLEELELAAHDGRLAATPGFGAKRVAGVQAALAARLGRGGRRPEPAGVAPPVGELLEVDRQYRESARAGSLPRIAPRRFNPEGRAWLPVLHTTRGSRQYTALFSNTALAHRLGRTRDWVVLYSDGPREERQATVVTATTGPLRGRRVVRGRELECESWYAGRRRAARRQA
jgi:DNA polymerase (family X)